LLRLQRSKQSKLLSLWLAIWRSQPKLPLFWMDTLCIPVQNEQKTLRMKAINQMSLIYAAAEQVLVLDNELRQRNTANEPIELIHARMLASKWNTRSWTLQEGALAQKVYFQFKDQARLLVFPLQGMLNSFFSLVCRALRSPRWAFVCMKDFTSNLRRRMTWSMIFTNSAPSGYATMVHSVQRSLHVLASTHFDLRIYDEVLDLSRWTWLDYTRQRSAMTLRERFEITWTLLGQRTTTMAEDLHFIIANLVGFSISHIMELPTLGERTKMFLYNIGSFDVGYLCNKYTRLSAGANSPDRWIPAYPAPGEPGKNATLVFEERGLVFRSSRKLERVRAFLVENSAPLKTYWVQYSRPRKSLVCHHKKTTVVDNHQILETHSAQALDCLQQNGNCNARLYLEGTTPIDMSQDRHNVSRPQESTARCDSMSSCPVDGTGQDIVYEWYRITCSLPEVDDLDRLQYDDKNTCIFFVLPSSRTPATRLRGARLAKTSYLQTDGKLHFRYDCPLECSIQTSPPTQAQLQNSPILSVTETICPCRILIESRKCTCLWQPLSTDPMCRKRLSLQRHIYHSCNQFSYPEVAFHQRRNSRIDWIRFDIHSLRFHLEFMDC
jgi:hypothetical protein